VLGCCIIYHISELLQPLDLFQPTPMLLVSVRLSPDKFRIQSKLPLSTGSQSSCSPSLWSKLTLHQLSTVGIVTAAINNNDPDLTKHAWGFKGLSSTMDYLFTIMEWQHVGLVHIPQPPSVPPAHSLRSLTSTHSTHPPPYFPYS
jgi:hypothetical protein